MSKTDKILAAWLVGLTIAIIVRPGRRGPIGFTGPEGRQGPPGPMGNSYNYEQPLK